MVLFYVCPFCCFVIPCLSNFLVTPCCCNPMQSCFGVCYRDYIFRFFIILVSSYTSLFSLSPSLSIYLYQSLSFSIFHSIYLSLSFCDNLSTYLSFHVYLSIFRSSFLFLCKVFISFPTLTLPLSGYLTHSTFLIISQLHVHLFMYSYSLSCLP